MHYNAYACLFVLKFNLGTRLQDNNCLGPTCKIKLITKINICANSPPNRWRYTLVLMSTEKEIRTTSLFCWYIIHITFRFSPHFLSYYLHQLAVSCHDSCICHSEELGHPEWAGGARAAEQERLIIFWLDTTLRRRSRMGYPCQTSP